MEFWNRRTGLKEQEAVYGGKLLAWAYQTRLGRWLLQLVLTHPWVSHCYGLLQSSRFSRWGIAGFIRKFQIAMEDFEPGPFASFNHFFIRQLKEGAREFVRTESLMPAFAEGRYFAYSALSRQASMPVKGGLLTLEELIGPLVGWKKLFVDGPALVARLCPTDYHRFHFPDAGLLQARESFAGRLDSVNPLALAYKPRIFLQNQRVVSLLQTKNFGHLAFIEVGALCVGKIVQTSAPDQPFLRGQEKGYFLFGGSSVLVLGEKGAWEPKEDLLNHTQAGLETLVRLGEPVATKLFPPAAY